MPRTLSPPAIRRRFGWLMLLVAALLARGVAPDGWMPVATAEGGIEIALCNGMGPADTMVLTPDGKLHHKTPAKPSPGDHPCAFAGLGIADAPPSAVMIGAPRSAEDETPVLASPAFAPGRGLAAPPPPATGPPARA